MARFTHFHKLPSELRDEIWELSVADPHPEVCIIWPLVLNHGAEGVPSLPLMVDTSFPSVYHTCREARAAVERSGALQLRHSSVAGFAVPCRAFDPAIDTLYWSRQQNSFMKSFLKMPENAALARSLRHIAIQVDASFPPSDLAELARQNAIFLRSLALVLPDGSECQTIGRHFVPPARWFRLKDISEQRVKNIVLENVPFLEWHMERRQRLVDFVSTCRSKLDLHVKRFNVEGDEGTAWSVRDDSFTGLQIKVQTFTEYSGKGRMWEEVCGHRMVAVAFNEAPQIRRIPMEERKGMNPKEYRVLDEDCGRFGEGFGEHISESEATYPAHYLSEMGFARKML